MARQRTRTIVIPVPPEIAHRASYDTFVEVAGDPAKVYVEGPAVKASIKIGWKSWGEDIAALVFPDQGGSRVELSSKAVMPTQLFDLGKHDQNLDQIVGSLGGRLGVPVHEVARR